MKSKFAIAGHPIHPALVALPIGLIIWTLVADIVYLASDKDHMWYDIAFWSGIAAIVSALIAALPGFGDYITTVRATDAADMATMHMALNLSTVALFFVAMLLMLDDGALDGTRLTIVVVLHALGVGLVSLAGWLGGEMVFRHHVGMVPDNGASEQAEHLQHELRPELRRR